MNLAHTGGWSCTHSTSDITSTLLNLIELTRGRHDARIDIGVGSHILGFLLGPNDFGLGEKGSILGDAVKGKGGNLFQTNNGHIGNTTLFSLRQEFVVDLTSAKDKCLHILRVGHNTFIRLVQNALKVCTRTHLVKRRDATLVAEQVLGCHHNERLTEVTMNLTTETMEVTGWRSAVHHLPIRLLNLHSFVGCHGWDKVRVFVNLL
mmetsp:Transcript_22054/g.36499  ORF Transcript_22054/g.36499 Transcript_22054/m.36499 type:complete len:206 (-) Transcript_22054:435-1052(-)